MKEDAKRSDTLASGLSKIDRYGWTSKDQRGVYEDVDKKLLNVDRSSENAIDGYQRDLTEARSLTMAANWSWAACLCLGVSRRPDGSLWIFEGQHRFFAAEKRADITHLPCLVFDVSEKSTEARAFLDANTSRRPMQAIEKFRAQIISGDAAAIGVERLTTACGLRISKGTGNNIGCVSTLIKCFRMNEAILETVLLVCVEAFSEAPSDRLLDGMFYLESYLVKNKAGSISARHNVECLKAAGKERVMQSIASAVSFYSRGGAKHFAEGIVRVLNHKRSSRRLPSVVSDEQ